MSAQDIDRIRAWAKTHNRVCGAGWHVRDEVRASLQVAFDANDAETRRLWMRAVRANIIRPHLLEVWPVQVCP